MWLPDSVQQHCKRNVRSTHQNTCRRQLRISAGLESGARFCVKILQGTIDFASSNRQTCHHFPPIKLHYILYVPVFQSFEQRNHDSVDTIGEKTQNRHEKITFHIPTPANFVPTTIFSKLSNPKALT